LAYGGDNRIVLTGQYFDIWGTADAGLFGTDPDTGNALTPNSNGWMAEIAYIPFGLSKSFGWPWFNARIGLQYIYYNKFNGTTVGAQDNNHRVPPRLVCHVGGLARRRRLSDEETSFCTGRGACTDHGGAGCRRGYAAQGVDAVR